MEIVVQAAATGIVQGLTEFLPISSSGHLILVPWLMGWHDPFLNSLAFSVMLHVGTLAGLLLYFQADWRRLVPAWFASLRERRLGGDPDRRLAWMLVLGTAPAAVAGLLFEDAIERGVREPQIVAAMLLVGAAILLLADRLGRRTRAIDSLRFGDAMAIGVAQALALVPGVSRSGISISAGLALGLDREAAARFSFLLATPAIAGAGLLESYGLLRGGNGITVDLAALVIGMATALAAGLVAIHGLLAYLRHHGLGSFVAYRIALAALVGAVLLAR